MPSALMLTLPLACLVTLARAEADPDPLTLILASPTSAWSAPGGHYYPDQQPSGLALLNPQSGAGVQQQRNLANLPRINPQPSRILQQQQSQFFLKPAETLTPNLVLGLPGNGNYYNGGSVLVQRGLAQPSRSAASNVGVRFSTQSNNQRLPSVFSPLPVRGINNNNMMNRGVSNSIRNGQRFSGNNRNSMNDRFIHRNNNPQRDYNSNNIRDSNINRLSKYNCSSDGIFPDISSDCQKYYVCQGSQVWEFACTVGKLYDASLGACAPASTVDNWCNAPNSVNNQPIREEYPGSDPIRGLDSVNYGPGTSDYDSGSNIVLEMSDTSFETICGQDGVFPDLDSDCEKYYVCNGQMVWRYTCNPGLLFDAKIGACNWRQSVDLKCNT